MLKIFTNERNTLARSLAGTLEHEGKKKNDLEASSSVQLVAFSSPLSLSSRHRPLSSFLSSLTHPSPFPDLPSSSLARSFSKRNVRSFVRKKGKKKIASGANPKKSTRKTNHPPSLPRSHSKKVKNHAYATTASKRREKDEVRFESNEEEGLNWSEGERGRRARLTSRGSSGLVLEGGGDDLSGLVVLRWIKESEGEKERSQLEVASDRAEGKKEGRKKDSP